jgi:hypothetical protein
LLGGRIGELSAARPAEALAGRHFGAAMRASQDEAGAALPAEPRPARVRSLATWTPHLFS